ncbi:LOW QUALITY PROTEIN: Hypothetical protein PHPALM_53 [Phytophthora palmivora]|uniref:Uncharacterized protein n=1 Tax=Phytophthora palmivora TaxID=4796 RepID=A0A2P4YVT8_9STRA|nr:LOW QUALITY PROTEIN: Hypothetical protein PHPALM_53 [Phytophthora palmivora]
MNDIIIEDTSMRLPGIAVSAVERQSRAGYYISHRRREHTWVILHEHVLQHFDASNYQAVLCEKL